MENASKALLIAGGVLLAILVLTLYMYIYTKMANDTSEIYSALNHPETSKFNQKFLNYEGRGTRVILDAQGNSTFDYLTIQDVVTIVNMAKDNNDAQRNPTTIAVNVGRI